MKPNYNGADFGQPVEKRMQFEKRWVKKAAIHAFAQSKIRGQAGDIPCNQFDFGGVVGVSPSLASPANAPRGGISPKNRARLRRKSAAYPFVVREEQVVILGICRHQNDAGKRKNKK